jgi:hypothetical protein
VKRQGDRAEANLVTVPQPAGCRNALASKKRSVLAAEIFNLRLVATDDDTRVMARDTR